MTTRITEYQTVRTLLGRVAENRARVDKYSDQVASGLKVRNPGDSDLAGTIAQYQSALTRLDSYKNRIATVESQLIFQDDVMTQANELLIRAKEIATQVANETVDPAAREQMSAEVFAIRDHLVSLANSPYQGKYIFGAARDNTPPYTDQVYDNPATGSAAQQFVYNAGNELGYDVVRVVNVTDDLTIETTTPGNQLFDNAIQGLERLGRAMAGYATNPATGAPDGTGNAYVFPNDYGVQTQAIRDALDIIDSARETDVIPERNSLGGRLKRLETAQSLIDLSKNNAQEVLDKLQNADEVEAASMLAEAQTALQASFTVTAQVLNISILDYI